NDVAKSLRASATSPGGFAVRSPFRDFVHLKVLRNAKHFAKPPGVSKHIFTLVHRKMFSFTTFTTSPYQHLCCQSSFVIHLRLIKVSNFEVIPFMSAKKRFANNVYTQCFQFFN